MPDAFPVVQSTVLLSGDLLFALEGGLDGA